jgi:hypothetical protein
MHVQDVLEQLFDDENMHNTSSSDTDNYFEQSENEQDLLHYLLNNFGTFLHFL